jgi:hypothetical protein
MTPSPSPHAPLALARRRATRVAPSLRALLLAPVLATLACNPTAGTSNAPPASTVVIQTANSGTGPNKSVTLGLGDTVRLSYSVGDVFGHSTGITPTFATRDGRIVSVSRTGLLRALGAGTTYVTATATTVGTAVVRDSIRVSVLVVCTLEARAGIVIAVEDSLTGSKGPFSNVSYVAKDTSAYRDSTLIATVPAQLSGSTFLAGLAYEHPGKYDVTVRATGYKPWVKSGVVVTKDACHVIAVSLTARLLPQ